MAIHKFDEIKNFRKHGTINEHGEQCYECQLCTIYYGQSKSKPSLYWNVKKRRGKCFRCQSTIVYGKKLTLEEICQDYLDQNNPEELPNLSSWDISKWTYPIKLDKTNDEILNYLKNRNISWEIIEKFGIRSCNIPYKGIVLPNGLNPNNVDFFQVRNIDSNASMRYTNPSSTKPVYGSFLEPKTEAIICEGVFSTISTYSPEYNSYGLFGKSASMFQSKWLEDNNTELYNICLDGGEYRSIIRLAEQILKYRDRVGIVFLPWKKDPNNIIGFFDKFYANRSVINKVGLTMIKSKLKTIKEENEDSWKKFYSIVKGISK